MGLLTANSFGLPYQGDFRASIREGQVGAGQIIYRYAMIRWAAAGGLGRQSGQNQSFAGIALEYVDNSGGGIGDKRVRYLARGAVTFHNVAYPFADTHEGIAIYTGTDNPEDVTVVPIGTTRIGWCLLVHSADVVTVELDGARGPQP